MATITPLLDTLLHEVLGRRMDSPSRPPLTPPVAPVYPSKATQAVQGDVRLQSRGGAVEVQDARRTPGHSSSSTTSSTPGPQAASSYTRLSPAAHLISNVLARFPAPPSVIRPAVPLLPAAAPSLISSAPTEGSQPASYLLRERLTGSLGDSGLFYESHLRSWFRGTMPLERLLRQPQMQGQQIAAPAQQLPAGASPTQPASTPTQPATPAAEVVPREMAEARADATRSVAPLPLEQSETLQNILRHQLELLITPVLRWEGEVWPGLFMSLVLELPRQEAEARSSEDGRSKDAADECYAEVELIVEGLGELRASLLLRDDHLSLTVVTPSQALYGLMESGRELLRERLQREGLNSDLQFLLKDSSSD